MITNAELEAAVSAFQKYDSLDDLSIILGHVLKAAEAARKNETRSEDAIIGTLSREGSMTHDLSTLRALLARCEAATGADAVALIERVLPGASGWILGKGKLSEIEPPYGVRIYQDLAGEILLGEAEANTLPLALLCALLRALIAEEERADG
jgi:hypothetical protein